VLAWRGWSGGPGREIVVLDEILGFVAGLFSRSGLASRAAGV
jgi:hypothetical protein